MTQSVLQILVQLKDEASSALNGMVSSLDKYKSTFQEVGIIGGAMLGSVSAVAYKSIKDYSEAEAAARQLEHAVLNITGATRDQLDATSALADQLERKGVLDGDAIKAGAAQLSTFGLTNESVQALMGSMADLAVNQYGVSAGTDQLIDSANILAKALNGQFGILEKSGIRFTDAQKKIIEFGTEQEKVAAVNEVMAKNLRYTNDVAKQTAEGGIAALKVQMGNMSESIGQSLAPALTQLLQTIQPVIEKVTGWIQENPKLAVTIMAIVAGIGGLLVVMAAVGLAIPAIVGGFTAIATAAGVLGSALLFLATNPIGLIIVAIAALVAATIYIVKNWDEVKEKILQVWEMIKLAFNNSVAYLKNLWNNTWTGIKATVDTIWTGIQTGLQAGWIFLVELFNSFIEPLNKAWSALWAGIGAVLNLSWEGIRNTIKASINWILEKINSVIRSINAVAGKAAGVFGGTSFNIPEIPMLAEGGIVTRPTLAMIGEAGPEAVVPLNRFSGGGQAVNITVNITGNNISNKMDLRDISDQVSESIMAKLRLNGRLAV